MHEWYTAASYQRGTVKRGSVVTACVPGGASRVRANRPVVSGVATPHGDQ